MDYRKVTAMVPHLDLEKVDDVVNKIARTVHSGVRGDGIIAVMPVSRFLHIRDFAAANQTE